MGKQSVVSESSSESRDREKDRQGMLLIKRLTHHGSSVIELVCEMYC